MWFTAFVLILIIWGFWFVFSHRNVSMSDSLKKNDGDSILDDMDKLSHDTLTNPAFSNLPSNVYHRIHHRD